MKQKFNSVRSTALKKLLIKEIKMNMKTYVKTCFCLLLLSLLVVFSAAPAWANTAANTQIINQADLSYNDGTGIQHKTATVTVVVSLVPSTPSVITAVGGPYSTNYATGATLIDTFTIVSSANGPDTYNLSTATGSQVNNGGTGSSTMLSGTSVVIGATVTVAGSSTTVLNVPSDGVNDGTVNGITAGDKVVVGGFGGTERTVLSVVDNASGTSTITLTVALGAPPAAGVLVAGEKNVTVTDAAGTIVTPGVSVLVPEHLTVASNTDNTKTVTTSDVQNTYFSGLATLTKYVRNVTTANGSGTSTTYGGNTYYLANVKAVPNDVLEYLLVSTNSGTGFITASTVTDGLPTAYVTFQTGVYAGGKDITYVNALNVASQLTAAAADDAGQYTASTLTVNVGTTPGIPPAAGGTIQAGETVKVLYQVKVN
jgi:hypothetical protein